MWHTSRFFNGSFIICVCIYITDLFNACSKSLPILFADDTNLFVSGYDLPRINTILSDEHAELSVRLKVNKLSLNIKKTHHMIFTRKNHIDGEIDLKIDNQGLRLNLASYLGCL